VFLLYLAVTAGLNARRAHLDPDQRLTARGGLVTGLLARGLSPYPYLFWFLVGGPTVMRAAEADWLSPLAFVVGYYVTIVGSNVAVALALNRWMRLVSERLYRTLLFAASIILAAYGLVLLAYSRTSTRP
jgi:threonine/homoserine/homoserine lactone efflux protein